MARKIIKVILFILLAVVVAGGIMTYLRSQKKISSPTAQSQKPAETVAPKVSNLQEILVTGQGASAQVQIKGIQEKNFNISNLPNGDGFKIQVPNAQTQSIQKLLDKPHPLIKKIEVKESAENPSTAEVIFYTEKNVNFLDTQKDGVLTIDFVKTDAQPETSTASNTTGSSTDAAVSSVGTKTSPSSKSAATTTKTSKASKKAKAAVSKKSKSSNLASKSKKSKSSSSIKLQPFDPDMVDNTDIDAEAETLIPQEKTPSVGQEKADRSMDLSAFGTTPSTENIPLGQEQVPTIEPDNSARFADPDANDGFNLKEIVKEEPKNAPPANLLDAETEMSLKDNLGSAGNVASLPSNQKFDINKVQANLPALQSVDVQRAGNSTMVTFNREKAVPYKVFRMVNPSRIVVDFKDVKNQLKSDYPRFAGTKISRIETRAYGSADGQLVRVIMYVDGAPNYKSDKRGNQLVLELQ